MIEILSTGLPNLVQDLGREGSLALGISRSGALDTVSLSIGNLSVGNPENAAGIEISLFPFRVRFLADGVFCCTGADCTVQRDDDAAPLPAWWTYSVRAGQSVIIAPPRRGARAYLTIRGGVDVPVFLGSRATDLKAGFGGLQGRGLRRGDTLPIGKAQQGAHIADHGIVPSGLPRFWRELQNRVVPVRVLPAAEHDAFTPQAHEHFYGSDYTVTPDGNRMGYRLSGRTLAMAHRRELLSHGIVPGIVQVPPSGQPVIQLAEANTCGGYPKIATVIEADLWKVGQTPPGCALRFVRTDLEQAIAATRAQAMERSRLRQSLAMATASH